MRDDKTGDNLNDDSGIIPLVPDELHGSKSGGSGRGGAGMPRLTDMKMDACPNCGAAMAADAVVCTKCGLDLKAGEMRRPEVGVDEIEETPAVPEFVTLGRGEPKLLLIVGGVLTVVAMVAAGINTPGDKTFLKASVGVLTGFMTILHTGTGVAAVALAAVLAQEKLSHLGLAAARMFVAFALFQAVRLEHLPEVNMKVGGVLLLLFASAMYFVTVLVLFKKHYVQGGTIAVLHLCMWGVLELGIMLSAFVSSELRALPGAAG